jgi:hypothetical protein
MMKVFISCCERRLSNITYDSDAWTAYPEHRWLFNKLAVAMRLGYRAGPAGIPIPQEGSYIVRPTYNLSGMGVSPRRLYLEEGDNHSVKPGEFWCEFFEGPNVTIDYVWQDSVLTPVFAAQGDSDGIELFRFTRWHLITPPAYQIPDWISELQDVPRINIEFIDGHLIEIHLRPGIDFPDGATEIVPIWSDSTEAERQQMFELGYELHHDPDDADGHLKISRVGFFYK